ncbi:MAG: DUF1592 domain-containing protein [Bdellovibrionota bacterium]
MPAGTTGVPEANAPVCSLPLPVLNAQRLTKLEYNNVIRDLFGLTDNFSANFSNADIGPSGFSTDPSAQNLSASIVLDFYNGANAVTAALFAKNPNPLFATCSSGDTCATSIIANLARKAFRRPPTTDEKTQLFNLYKSVNSTNISDGLKLVVTGVLISPQFLFRTYEIPTTKPIQAPLTDFEIASRVSFLIWGSIPDETLLSLAEAGKLKDKENLTAQVKRLMADPRSSYITKSFGYQWANLNRFEDTVLDVKRFPNWNNNVKTSMKNETMNFLNNIFVSDQSVMDIVNANYTFVDQNVSQIYGIPGVSSANFVKVNLDTKRMGLLSQPAILSMNSLSDHTSPVSRGQWVLDRILCSSPPPPPDDVPFLPSSPNGNLTDEASIRKKLEVHRTLGSSCYGCHKVMDFVGLAFENFDSMGYFRNQYINGTTVDASGKLPTGEVIQDYSDLANILKKDERFPACFAMHFSSFAQGRDMSNFKEICGTQAIAKKSIGEGKKFSSLVVDIVLQNNFLNRVVGY